MNHVVPWKQVLALVAPFDPKAGRPSRRLYALETLLRIHFLQPWLALSDPAMAEALYDRAPMRHVAQFSGNDAIAD